MSDHTRVNQQLQFDFPATRVCTKCGETKPLSEFYLKKSGKDKGKYWAFCRACDAKRGREYAARNRQEIVRKRLQYNEANREYLRARDRERISDPEIRKQRAEHTKQWRKKNPEIVARYGVQQWSTEGAKARQAVYNAVRRGDFPPVTTQVCEYCQEALAAQWHHHKGYGEEFILEVVALCTECHGKAHWEG